VTPPGDYADTHAPLGRADLPTGSYPEMAEWALPTGVRERFHAVQEEFTGRPEVAAFLRGGSWRGFFRKYPEANLLHKKMLRTGPEYQALLKPSDGGTVAALDFRPSAATLINSMQRRPEAYHARLRGAPLTANGGVTSIHEQTRVKEPNLERFLKYDRWA